jgi:hypothetical protein
MLLSIRIRSAFIKQRDTAVTGMARFVRYRTEPFTATICSEKRGFRPIGADSSQKRLLLLLDRFVRPTRDYPAASADDYRSVAAEIIELAAQCSLPEVRNELLEIAERFRRMADWRERGEAEG